MLLLLLGCAETIGLEGGVWQALDPLPGQVDQGCDAVFALGPVMDGEAALGFLDDCGGFGLELVLIEPEGPTEAGAAYLVGEENGGLGTGWPFLWETTGDTLRIWDDAEGDLPPVDRIDGARPDVVVGLARVGPE